MPEYNKEVSMISIAPNTWIVVSSLLAAIVAWRIWSFFTKKGTKKWIGRLDFLISGCIWVPICIIISINDIGGTGTFLVDCLAKKNNIKRDIRRMDSKWIGRYLPQTVKSAHKGMSKGFNRYGGRTIVSQTTNVARSAGMPVPKVKPSRFKRICDGILGWGRKIGSFFIPSPV